MDDLHCRIVDIDAAKAQIDNDLLRRASDVFEKNVRLPFPLPMHSASGACIA